jgi:hypothetical protein
LNQWEIESGEIGTLDSIRTEMLAKLRDYYMNKVFTALTTVWTAVNNASNFTNVGGPLTAVALKNSIDNINTNSGGVKAVVGTRAALTPITTFGAGWTDSGGNLMEVPDNIREIMATGFLGRYYGAPIIALQQQYDNPEDYHALLPTDKVLVIGHNVGEFITYGDIKTKQWQDMNPTPPQWYLELFQIFSLLIDRAEGIHVLKVS